MARVVHFDISGTEPEKLMPFYEKIFGWTFQKWEGPMEYWMVTTGSPDQPGIDGGLALREQDASTVNTIEVEDLDAVIEQVKQAGGKATIEKGPIPGIGWYAQIADPQGNLFGLMQSDPNAK